MAETIRIAKAIDPRINIGEDPVLILSESVPSVQFNVAQSTGTPSLNNTFNLSIPPNQGLSREIFMAFDVQFTITGTDLDAFQAENCVALRAWPLNATLQSCNINLGTNGVSMNCSLYQPVITQWNADSKIQNSDFSSFPSAPDIFSSYDVNESNISPFEPIMSSPNSQYTNSSRTGQITNIVYNTGNTEITITASIIEPIMLSPFTYTGVKDPKKSLFNLSNVVFNFSFNQLHRMLSMNIPTGATVNNVVGNFTSQKLLFEIVSPFEDSVLNSVRPTSYNYTNTTISTSTFEIAGYKTVASGVASAVLQFAFIPSHFVIWATPPQSALNNPAIGATIPDFNFSLKNVSINFAQRSNLIGSNAQPIQLYNMCKKNGSNTSYNQWIGSQIFTTAGNSGITFGGGCLIVDASADLSLPKSACVGMASQVNFQIQLDIINNSAINWGSGCQLNVAAFTPGICTIEYGGQVNLEIGAGITKQMYDEAPPLTSSSDESVKAAYNSNGYSGGSWASFKSALGNAASHVGHALAPVGQALGKALTNKAVDKGLEYVAMMGAGKMNRGKVRGLLKGAYM